MSSEQYTVSSILSQLRLFEWKFQIQNGYSPNFVSLRCIAFSVEEARQQILSMLTQFENLTEEKNKLDAEKKDKLQQIKYSRGTDYIDCEINYYAKIKQMYQCDITYEHGCRDSSIQPYDYTRDMKVVNSHMFSYTLSFIRLEDLIKTVEPTINHVNLISFNVGQ